jgi:hypothetical protein
MDNTETSQKEKKSAKTALSRQKDFENIKIKQFLEFWSLQYEQLYQRQPTLVWGREVKRLGPIFKQHDEGIVKAAALGYLTDQSDFVAGHGLGIFVSQFDRWVVRATRSNTPRLTSAASGGGKFDALLTL